MAVSDSTQDRDRGVVRTGWVGIGANLLLAAFKATVGLASHSIAIVLDAVNNLSDALSSVITIVGTKLARKPADRDHPYGHGRTEYIATIIIAAIVTWAGVTSLMESVARIREPEVPSYGTPSLIVVAVAIGAKIALGLYTKKQGERYNSDSLVASGVDALNDAIISTATLVAAIVFIMTGLSLEAWLGAVISIVIIRAGVEILQDAISNILGKRVSNELAASILDTVRAVPGVIGAYDLVLHDYGPDRLSGSVHIEVEEDMTAREVDALTRQVQLAVMRDEGILIHTVGLYASNASDGGDVGAIRAALLAMAEENPYVMEVHGFYADVDAKEVTFDLVVGWDAEDRRAELDGVLAKLREEFPDYSFQANLDADISG